MSGMIDSDPHLFEPRDLSARYIDPAAREDALAIVDDDLGHAWLTWRGRRLGLADIQWPGETDTIGERREGVRKGCRAPLQPRRPPCRSHLVPCSG